MRQSALHALASEIHAKRIELLYSFKDQDRQNRGYISANNFVRVISSANLVTSHVRPRQFWSRPSASRRLRLPPISTCLDAITDGARR